jgi:pimeloyl-ACP methyl ester carboxylesterase
MSLGGGALRLLAVLTIAWALGAGERFVCGIRRRRVRAFLERLRLSRLRLFMSLSRPFNDVAHRCRGCALLARLRSSPPGQPDEVPSHAFQPFDPLPKLGGVALDQGRDMWARCLPSILEGPSGSPWRSGTPTGSGPSSSATRSPAGPGGEDLRALLQAHGKRLPGGFLVKQLDLFTKVFVPGGIKRRNLSSAEKDTYHRPHPTPQSRIPVHVMPREILAAHELLTEVEQGLPRLARLPALIVWGDRNQAFKEPQRLRWEGTFPNHETVILNGASHYIQEDAPMRSSPRSRSGGLEGSRGAEVP